MRAIIELARRYKQGPVPASTISKVQSISILYLEQLLNKLKKKGIIDSVRGAGGGYILLRDPYKISAYEVMKELEGNLTLVDCVGENNFGKCKRQNGCATKKLWGYLSQSMENALKSVSIGMLAFDGIEKNKANKINHKYTYSI